MSSNELSAAYEKSQKRRSLGAVGRGCQPVRREDGVAVSLSDSGEAAVLFCGIIDILQQYGARKQLEHRYKAMRYLGNRAGISAHRPAPNSWLISSQSFAATLGISVTDPRTYERRFLAFILGSVLPGPPPASRVEEGQGGESQTRGNGGISAPKSPDDDITSLRG